MAVTSKVLARTAAATSSTTLYTVPSATTTIITNIVVTNASASSGTFTLLLNDIELQFQTPIAGNSSIYIDLKQALPATQTIKGLASATSIDFHISGVEIA